jgi:purine catabolism regulator
MSHDAIDRLLEEAAHAGRHHAARALRPLSEYDAAHGGDLIRTLRVYLASGCNASRAAEALYLHRSGLLYRLRRIEALLGVDLDDHRTRVGLEIAFLGWDTTGAAERRS